MSDGRVRILSVDGGGIRGIVPATVLADLERRAQRPVAELFDLVAGTSTGGLIALALTRRGEDEGPRWSAADVLDLYLREGPRIFSRSLSPAEGSGRRVAGRAARATAPASGARGSSRCRARSCASAARATGWGR